MSAVDELVAFLRRCLDRDEQVARGAGRGWEPDDPRMSDAEIAHTVRWDPARVLAEVQAKRRILDLHAPFVDHAGRVRCGHCSELCHSRSGLGCDDPADAMHPCETVALLAQPYAGQPGWREEWQLSAPS